MSTKNTKPVFKTDVDKRGGGGPFFAEIYYY